MAAACLLGGLVVLTQTRAAPLAFAITALLIVALVPGRTRQALGRSWLCSPGWRPSARCCSTSTRRATPTGTPDSGTIRVAALAMLGGRCWPGAAWAAASVGVERWARRATGRLRPATVSTAALCGLAVAALAALVLAVGNPVEQAEQEVRAFVNLEDAEQRPSGSTRFATAGGARYDYWRIAVDEFASAPLGGLGAGNYTRDYFAERRTLEDVTQPHSIELQTLAELGLVGILALLAFLGGIGAGLVRRVREAGTDARAVGLTVAAAGTFVTWLVHTSVDWLHVIPGVTGIALFAGAVLVAPWARERGSRASGGHAVAVALCALLSAAGALTVGRAALADRYRSQAEEPPGHRTPRTRSARPTTRWRSTTSRSTPTTSSRPPTPASATSSGSLAALREAADREPSNFVTYALMGDLAKRRGDYGLSSDFYRSASERNPRDGLLRDLAGGALELRASARAGRPKRAAR